MHGGGKRQAVAAIEISLDAFSSHSFRRVEVNTDKDGIGVRIRDRNAHWQRDKNIAVAGHDHVVAAGGKKGFETLRDIQRHFLFRDSLARNTAPIKTAVAGVDHHRGVGPAYLRIMARLRCSRGGARYICNRKTHNN